MKIALRGVVLFLVLAASGPACLAAQPTTFKMVSAFTATSTRMDQFHDFVKQVNADDALGVHIDVLGGPDVIPPSQLGLAVHNGVVDMIMLPANYLYSQVRAGEALLASKVDAAEARKNGGLQLLNSIYESRLGAHLLAWVGSGVPFYIWTTREPKFSDEGRAVQPKSIRSVSVYKDLLLGMGFNPVTVQISDVYTALQRGAVGGVGWPLIGIGDLKWTDYLKYRVEPGFYNTDVICLVNLKSWQRLTEEQRRGFQAIADAFEIRWTQESIDLDGKTEKEFAAGGGKVFHLEGAALKRLEHLDRTVPWTDMKNAGIPATTIDALRAKFDPTAATEARSE